MSELEGVLFAFHNAKRAERTASGEAASICVAGWVSYAELSAALLAKYSGLVMKKTKWTGRIEYDGVTIYPSRSIEEGFYFGHLDPEP